MSLSALKAAEVPKLSWSQWAQMAYQHCCRPQVNQTNPKHYPWIQKSRTIPCSGKFLVKLLDVFLCYLGWLRAENEVWDPTACRIQTQPIKVQPWVECLEKRSTQGLDHPNQARDCPLHKKFQMFPQKLWRTDKLLAAELKGVTHLGSLNNESLNDSDQCSGALTAELLQIRIKDMSRLTEQW